MEPLNVRKILDVTVVAGQHAPYLFRQHGRTGNVHRTASNAVGVERLVQAQGEVSQGTQLAIVHVKFPETQDLRSILLIRCAAETEEQGCELRGVFHRWRQGCEVRCLEALS